MGESCWRGSIQDLVLMSGEHDPEDFQADVPHCPNGWEEPGTLKSDNWIDDKVYILAEIDYENSINTCAATCLDTIACTAFTYVGGSTYDKTQKPGTCTLYKRQEPTDSKANNIRFCRKTDILPMC